MEDLDKTQLGPEDQERTVIGAPPDADRTVIGTPSAGPPVQFDCLVGKEVESAARPDHVYVLLRAIAAATAGARLPANLCLLIDRSGSMDGQPLEYAKQACGYVVDTLEPTDVLSIVAFDDQVDVVMPPRRVVSRELIKQHIGKLFARGTTNIYDGLAQAQAQVASLGTAGYVARVVFLTDGAPTTGIKEHGQIVALAKQGRDTGIAVSTLGFGIEYNEELLTGIARAGGGSHFYISRPEMIPEVFRVEIGSLMRVVAKDLVAELRLSRWVHPVQTFGKEGHIAERFVSFPLMDLEAGNRITALTELSLLPRPAGTYRLARVVLHYNDCTAGQAPREEDRHAVVRFTEEESEVPSDLHPEVGRELEVHRAARQLQETMLGLKTMQLSATQALDQLAATRSMLAQQGRELEATQIDLAISGLQQAGGPDPQKSIAATLHQLESGKQESQGKKES